VISRIVSVSSAAKREPTLVPMAPMEVQLGRDLLAGDCPIEEPPPRARDSRLVAVVDARAGRDET